MHPVPSGWSRGFDKLIPEEASVVGVPGGVALLDGEVEAGHLSTKPVINWKFHTDFAGWLSMGTGKRVIISSGGHSLELRNPVPVHEAPHTPHCFPVVGLLSWLRGRVIFGCLSVC